MPRTSTGRVEFMHEAGEECLVYRLEYCVTPGDDGDYWTPPCPPQCEFDGAVCTLVITEDEDYEPGKADGRSMGTAFMNDLERDSELRREVERACFADADERDEAALDAYWDAKFEASRCP